MSETISTTFYQVINVAAAGEDSPQDLSAGSSRENTPERCVVMAGRTSGTPGSAGVLNVLNVRKPPPAHKGSPNITSSQGRTVSPDKGGGMAGSPGLASLEQLTAGIGNMPPPLSKIGAVPSPPLAAPKPAHGTKPMPPLMHIHSGRVSGPPPVRRPAPPRLTPATVRPSGEQLNGLPRQAPPLQRAPSPAHTSADNQQAQRLSTRAPMGRGNPSVAVVQPMPPPPPPTPPEPPSPVEDDEFMDEEEAKRAFSVFNIQPNRARQQTMPAAANAAATATVNSLPPTPVVAAPPPRPVMNSVVNSVTPPTPSAAEPENDFSQFQVRPAIVPRYPTHAAGYGMTPPNNFTGGAISSPPVRPPPPYPAGQHVRNGTTAPTGAAQFVCPYCPYEGPSSSALKNHILTHQPNIQWICPYCPGPTRMTKTEVTNHIQTVHPACQLVYIPYGVTL